MATINSKKNKPSLQLMSTSSAEFSTKFVSPIDNYRANKHFQKTSLHQSSDIKKLTFSTDKGEGLYNLT